MSPRPDQPDEPLGPDNTDGTSGPPANAAERIIEKFGGIRPMAKQLDVPVTTVQGWKKRGAIPTARHADLLAAAARHGIVLDPEELAAAAPADERGTEDRPPADATEMPADHVAPEAEPASNAAPTDESGPTGTVHYPVAYTPHAQERSRGSGLAASALVLSLLALGAAATAPWWAPPLLTPVLGDPGRGGGELAQRVDTLNQRVEQIAARPQPDAGALERRIASVEQAVGALGSQPQTTANTGGDDLAQRIASLEQRIEAASQAGGGNAQGGAPGADGGARLQALAQRIEDMSRRIADLQGMQGNVQQLSQSVAALEREANRLSQDVATASAKAGEAAQVANTRQSAESRTQALVLATAQLRSALAESGPFAAELATVRQLGIEAPQVREALAAIAPRADSGIPTEAMLTTRFAEMADEIVRAGTVVHEGSWTDQALSRVTSLVSIRRPAGEGVEGSGADAIVSRAQAHLDTGDLEAAAAELDALQGDARAVAEPWLADTRARLAAERASRSLTDQAIARLAGETGGSATASGSSMPAPGQDAPQGGTVQP